MAQKPEIKFDQLYPKLYNTALWQMAYESIAPKAGNMTAGVDGKTIDGMGREIMERMIEDLQASRYTPTPVRRVYIEKANGKLRPLGIPSFQDKLLQTVIKLILEAIYEPVFSKDSHGFRPERSCHTALASIKRLNGIRWWVEGDIRGFFDNLNQETLLAILKKRITDPRFLHLIEQILKAGYVEDWQYHQTYSGTPQGGNLSPILSNVYLNELDQQMVTIINEFNQGKLRQSCKPYQALRMRKKRAKIRARQTGDWTQYKALRKELLQTEASDPLDPMYRRMYYTRYADDFLVGIIGSKAEANALKAKLADYLKTELHLELSAEKTLVTNVKERARFLGYDIVKWKGKRKLRYRNQNVVVTRRTCTRHLALGIPRDKVLAFAKTYGNSQGWHGEHRPELVNLSELEILMLYNAEIRGFLGYYALADNLKAVAGSLLWMTTSSFFRTLAAKRRSTLPKVAESLKTGPAQYVIEHRKGDGTIRKYTLIASTRQLTQDSITYGRVDQLPNTWKYRATTELGQRLNAQTCEWCGTQEGPMEVHHVRKLKDLKGKTVWELHMLARHRKTLVLCKQCHTELHAGRLSEKNKC